MDSTIGGHSFDGTNDDLLNNSTFTNFADGSIADYRIITSRNSVTPSKMKPPSLFGKIKFCRERIYEKNL